MAHADPAETTFPDAATADEAETPVTYVMLTVLQYTVLVCGFIMVMVVLMLG